MFVTTTNDTVAGVRFAEDDLAAIAGTTIFGRGVDYMRYVHGLQLGETEARASVQAKRVYQVVLSWDSGRIDGECSCAHNARGYFCKHLVAVGLSVLAEWSGEPALTKPIETAIHDHLDRLNKHELIELVEDLARSDATVLRRLQAHAVASGAPAAVDPRELLDRVSEAMPRGYVDYRNSFDAAQGIEAMLNELERLLDAGAAEQARPALERAVTRTRKVALHADDSGGVLGYACQRASELHARACREGTPDGVKLARWLVRFRSDSPGWPTVTLDMYAGSLGDKGLSTYRKAVHKVDATTAESSHFERFEVDRMLLELADHDGDLDEAVRLLSRDDEHTAYGAIVGRLRDAGRDGEALDWLDRAVDAGRVSGQVSTANNEYWLTPADAAADYLAAGRFDAALSVMRNYFARFPSPQAMRLLKDVAAAAGDVEQELAWALETAETLAAQVRDGSVLVRIALAENDLVAAWSAAERFGAGGAWKELAEASANDLPVAAADLYRPELDRLLLHPDTRVYGEVASILSTMRYLYERVGEQATVDAFIAEIREKYRRRTSLIAALDRAGLR